MEGGFILLILSAVLGGLVLILAAIYAYVFYTKIRPHQRHVHDDGYLRTPPQNTTQPEPEEKRLFHPFMILAYANRIKRDAEVA